MEFKLKNFEEKINDITDQFLSLLDSNYVIDDSITTKFDSASSTEFNSGEVPTGEEPVNNFDSFSYDTTGDIKIGGMAFADNVPGNHQTSDYGDIACGTAFSTDGGTTPIEFGGVTFNSPTVADNGAVSFDGIGGMSFDSIDQKELDRRLEELYQSVDRSNDVSKNNTFVFSDTNVSSFGNSHFTNYSNVPSDGYHAKDKEGYDMANYDGDNSLFSFATVPEDRALTTKRSFSDVLFMDIPWDTKIDIWGGIKSLFTTDIRITF
jgi:hypothetical protein